MRPTCYRMHGLRDLIHAKCEHKGGGCVLYLVGLLRSLSDESGDDAPAAKCWIAPSSSGFEGTPSCPAAACDTGQSE